MDLSDHSSPRRLQLQGPRQPRLALRKESHKIKKQPVVLAPQPQPQPLAPVIIYDASPMVTHTNPGDFMALIPADAAAGAPAAAQTKIQSPEYLLSPAARLAAIERSVRPLPPPPAPYGADVDSLAAVLAWPSRPGILSPSPASLLPPAASSGLLSSLPYDPTSITWLNEQSPALASARTRAAGLEVPFAPTPLPLNPRQSTPPVAEFFGGFPDLGCESGHGQGALVRQGSDAKTCGEAEPAGDTQVRSMDSADPSSPSSVDPSSIRRLFQQLVRLRTTLSSTSGALLSFSWFNNVKHLSSNAQECLQHLHYKMMLAMLGVGKIGNKVRSNVPVSSLKTTSTNFFQFASPIQLITIVSITDKLEGLEHGRPEWSAAAPQNLSKLFYLNRLVVRCILLCRGILGIMSIVGAEDDMKETKELHVFASDDLTYAGRDKVTRMNTQRIPTHVADPIYLLPTFIRSLLYLDLSGCSSLAQLPAFLGTLHNLAALNLSYCYSLWELPVSIGRLQNLKILVLSSCQKLQNLPVSFCELSNLRFLDLSGCSSLERLPYAFVTLRHLEILNLSDCKRLMELPQSFVMLQELKYLNLLGCHGVDLDVECILANLKCLNLSLCTDIQGISNSSQNYVNRLDTSRWWKKNWVHPKCNPKAESLHSHKGYDRSIIDRLLSYGSDVGDVTCDRIVTSICIVGESGMGKTELVHRIYNDQMILDAFNLRIWVNMCDKKRLLGKMIEFTTRTHCSDAPLSTLEEIVVEELTGKRFLLVLEDCDIESQYFWNHLWKLFNVCEKGSALIITTKSKEVAHPVGSMETCYLSSLSKEECFSIFREHVLGGVDINNYPQLESVGWKVVEKCGGNPMCIKALSGLLCHSEIGLCEIDKLTDGILPALRLCYDLLPGHLQQCFKFCSLFPKDYIFIRHHVVRLWIAQGFVFPKEGSQPEDTGLRYFDELFCRSFFQRSPFHKDQEDKFVIHELFHDLAHSISKKECFRCEEPFCSVPENISHISLVFSDFKTVALTKEVRNLRSFLVVRRFLPLVRILCLNDLFMKFGFLRALNLSYTDILELPSSIGNMKQLRFLAVNDTKIKGLPFQIGQVRTLQTLELKDCCHLVELPASMNNLTKLRHLDVRKERGYVKVGFPPGIGQLTDLQTLALFNVGNDSLHCSIGELKNLCGLRGHVHISGLENIKTADDAREANVMGKIDLEALTLEWCYNNDNMDDDLGKGIASDILQNLQPNRNLQELVIQNYAGNLFPVWMQDLSLCNLISITLDNCHDCIELPYFSDLPSLKYLFIQRMNAIKSFGHNCNPLTTEEIQSPRFPSLMVLTLWEMYDLQFWVGTSEGDFPRLCNLSISRCPKLINLPPLISLEHLSFHYGVQVPYFSELPSLKSLKIEGFHKIKSISFPYQLSKLEKLEINDCKELSSMFAYSLSVTDLKVVRCLKLDLVGSSLEHNLGEQVVGSRNSPKRRSVVLKTMTYTNLHDDGWNWKLHDEKNTLGSEFPRSYYRCININSTGCSARMILQPNNNDPNTLSIMYISKHNHESPNEPHVEPSTQHGTTHKRKESHASSDENISKRQLNNFSR